MNAKSGEEKDGLR